MFTDNLFKLSNPEPISNELRIKMAIFWIKFLLYIICRVQYKMRSYLQF